MYLLSINQELPNIRNRNKSVFVNWGEAITDSLGRHPKNYTSVSRSDFYNMRRIQWLELENSQKAPKLLIFFVAKLVIITMTIAIAIAIAKMSVVNKVNKVDVVVFTSVDINNTDKSNKIGCYVCILDVIETLKNNNISVYVCVKGDRSYETISLEEINPRQPNTVIVEYLKHYQLLEHLDPSVTTMVDTHDILSIRYQNFQKCGIDFQSVIKNRNFLKNVRKINKNYK